MSARSAPAIYTTIADALSKRPRLRDDHKLTVRAVANEFKVSLMTASRAIQSLCEKQNTKKIRRNGLVKGGAFAVALNVTAGPYRQSAFQLTASGFRALAQDTDCAFDFDTLHFDDQPSPGTVEMRVESIAKKGAEGIFLLPSREGESSFQCDKQILATARERGLPVVLLERNLQPANRVLTHDLVCIHDFHGGQALTEHLISEGRRRIAFLTASSTSYHLERLGGYLTASILAGLPTTIIHQPTKLSPRETITKVADELVKSKADAVICYHDYAAIGLILELLRREVSVPKRVAVAGFYGMPIGESFSLGVTTYSYPSALAALRAVDLMAHRIAHPDAEPMKWIIPGQLLVRESTRTV